MKLSAAIMTFNEEKNLDRTLKALEDICDEIVIVDSGSTDRTKEIADKYKAKFINQKWLGYGKQRNVAIDNCSGKWILAVDADEELSPQFKEKIKEFLKSGESYPNAHSKALKEVSGKEQNSLSNDILGIEYIKGINYWNSKIEPVTILREKVGYHSTDTEDNIASATAIRKFLKGGENIEKFLPKESFSILIEEFNNCKIVELKDFYPLLRYEIIRNRDSLKNIQDMEKGN